MLQIEQRILRLLHQHHISGIVVGQKTQQRRLDSNYKLIKTMFVLEIRTQISHYYTTKNKKCVMFFLLTANNFVS